MRSIEVRPASLDRWASARASGVSSVFGVCASVCAKYGLADEWTEHFVRTAVDRWQTDVQPACQAAAAFDLALYARPLFWFFRIAFVLLQLALNSLMLHHFVRSMHASNSLRATAYNQCFSLLLAGAFGYVCFGEALSPMWLAGSGLILAGVACVQWGSQEDELEPTTAGVDQTTTPTKPQAIPEAEPADTATTPRRRKSAPNAPPNEDAAHSYPLRSRSSHKPSAH